LTRALEEYGRQVVGHLLSKEFPGRNALAVQAASARLAALANSVSLSIQPDAALPVADVRYRVPVEAEASDQDGMPLHFLLHVVDGRLDELEIFRDDGERPIALPDPASLAITAYPLQL
jgi:hypothetical protein